MNKSKGKHHEENTYLCHGSGFADGEKARVKVSIETEDDSDRDNYYLNKVDGKWKIHL